MSKPSKGADLAHLADYVPIPAATVDPGVGAEVGEVALTTVRLVSARGFLGTIEEMERRNPAVSSRSLFLEEDWWLDHPQPSTKKGSWIRFAGIDPDLASELKLALLVAMAAPTSWRLKIRFACRLGRSLSILGTWMTHVGILTIAHLGPLVGEAYLQALFQFVDQMKLETIDEESGDWDPRHQLGPRHGKFKDVTWALIDLVAMGPLFLSDRAAELAPYLGVIVRGAPFPQTSSGAVAKEWRKLGSRTTERLPDCVVRGLVAGAQRLMDVPAGDVIRLVERFTELCDGGMTATEAADELVDFEFSQLKGQTGPWWPHGMRSASLSPLYTIHRLVHLLRDAGLLLVFLGVGLRPQEGVGLMSGAKVRLPVGSDHGLVGAPRPAWLPRCVTEAPSKSGFSILLMLHGHVFKHQRRPRPANWLLGGYQVEGADPLALDALRVLEALHGPLRRFAIDGAGSMLVLDFFEARRGTDLATCHLASGRLTQSMKHSIAFFADMSSIPDEEGGRDLRRYKAGGSSCIALYQCRKTYAQERYLIDPGLLPAISRQFQHRSPAGTLKSYVTEDPSFQREMELGRSRATSLLLREVMDGVVDVENSMSPLIDRVMASAGRSEPQALRRSLWDARRHATRGVFGSERMRPVAGAANLFAEARRAQMPGAGAPVGDTLTPDGPAVLRSFVADRRRWLGHLSAGTADAGRADRDRAIEAARWLNERGFKVEGLIDE